MSVKHILANDAVTRFLGGFAAGCLIVILAGERLFNVLP